MWSIRKKKSTFSKKKHAKRSTFSQNTSKKPTFSQKAREKVHFRLEKHPPKSRPGYRPVSIHPSIHPSRCSDCDCVIAVIKQKVNFKSGVEGCKFLHIDAIQIINSINSMFNNFCSRHLFYEFPFPEVYNMTTYFITYFSNNSQ